MSDIVQPGIYNIEYFSGSQVAIYIGDIWIDEVTSMSYSVQQSKQPLYGYADTLFRTMSKGQVLVQGQFTINFKEAGYLFLALDNYRKQAGLHSLMNPFTTSEDVTRKNIERFIDQEPNTFQDDRIQLLSNLAAQSALTGFSSNQRLTGTVNAQGVGNAEDKFEGFEDAIWKSSQEALDEVDRRTDDPRLNGFDIYVAFGDFAGNNRNNHTMQKISNVHIIGSGKSIESNGLPIQEQYTFYGRNIV